MTQRIPFFYSVLIFLSITFFSCRNEELESSDHAGGPIEEVHNLRLTYSTNGVNKVEVKAVRQLGFANENKVFPDSISILFYDSLGNLSSTLRSDSGRYNKKEDVYTVLGNVEGRDLTEGTLLLTEALNWNPKKQKIFNQDSIFNEIINVTVQDTFRGFGLNANQNFKNLSLQRGSGVTDLKMN